jgi:N-acetylmuramoyl-L-alanine amidase
VINLNDLKGQLKALENKLPKAEIQAAGEKIATQFKAAISTNAGSNAKSVVDGVKSLVESIDFAELERIAEAVEAEMRPIAEQILPELQSIARDIEQQINTSPTPGQLQAGLKNVTNKIEKTVQNSGALETLTGKQSSNGFLKATVNSVSPEGLREALLGIGENIKVDEISQAMESVLTPEVQAELQSVGSNVFEVTKKSLDGTLDLVKSGDLAGALKKVDTANTDLVKSGAFGKLQGLMENISGQLSGPIQQATGGLSPATLKGTIGDLTNLNVPEAVSKVLKEKPELDGLEIENTIKNIDPTIAGQTAAPAVSTNVLPPTTELGTTSNKWSSAPPDTIFTVINSEEELEAELASIKREITEVVVDWSATPIVCGDFQAKHLNKLSQRLYKEPIRYHYVIQKNGTLQRGRPIEELLGNIAIAGSQHTQYSIGVVMIGGTKSAEASDTDYNNYSAETLTPEQYKTLEKILKKFYQVYPSGQVFGRQDYDKDFNIFSLSINGNKGLPGPGFDLSEFVANKFGKTNIHDPTLGSFSPEQLLSRARQLT